MKIWSLACIFSLISCDARNSSPATTINNEVKTPTRVVESQRELIKVEGSHVSFRISTFVGISCKAYDGQFSSATPIKIADKVKLAAIDSRLKMLKPDIHKYQIDIRAKVVFFYDNLTSDTLCISQFNSYYKGGLVSNDVKLNELLGIKIK